MYMFAIFFALLEFERDRSCVMMWMSSSRKRGQRQVVFLIEVQRGCTFSRQKIGHTLLLLVVRPQLVIETFYVFHDCTTY
jgi:hypothetical protein